MTTVRCQRRLVVVQFAQISDDVLAWPGLGTRVDQGVVGVGLAVLGASVAAQEHTGLLVGQDDHGPA